MREPADAGASDELGAELRRLSAERLALLEARGERVRDATAAEARAVEALRTDAVRLARRVQPARNAALALDRDVEAHGAILSLSVGCFSFGFASAAGLVPALIAFTGAFTGWLLAQIFGSASLG